MSPELEDTQPLPRIVKKENLTVTVKFLEPDWFLNGREQELIRLAVAGLNQPQIARLWGIKPKHVRSQVTRIALRASEEVDFEVGFTNLTYVLQGLGKIEVMSALRPEEEPLQESV